ncbi:hypothetical protein [Cerasicoccus fimbriatus]|uniref:hypothetical protein n=1 Tax=Cerasicoccus fimbriatus TaxID=3014554 RepID=UPI0022B2D6A8|nr:hypothetical protein [Cerasicoccus sp. TK19100]
MKSAIILALFVAASLTYGAENIFQTIYIHDSNALISFLETEKKEEIKCVRVCVLNNEFRVTDEIYAQSAKYDGKQWMLHSANQIIYSEVTGDPEKKVNLGTKTLELLPTTIDALYHRSESLIVYLPGFHIFRPALDEKRRIFFVNFDSGRFLFVSSNSYEISVKEDQSACTLTLVDGIATQNPFSGNIKSLRFGSLPINLPFEAFALLNPNQSEVSTPLAPASLTP